MSVSLTTVAGITAYRTQECDHENQTGVDGTHWECDACGRLVPKTDSEIKFCSGR